MFHNFVLGQSEARMRLSEARGAARCVLLSEQSARHHGYPGDGLLMSTPDPSKHGTLSQCWFNVGPPSTTLAQH